ncbi:MULTISPECIES: KilA-N domain-containing protein [unclassified Bacteroides]|uniref:KilA-N domain-containing protein n=1 Tax=unclassified Bacteroides TaxID=2646097 RepID=UPI004064BE9E
MNNPIVYSYKGSKISFMSGENTMINATEMAKVFGKRPNDYLSLPSTNQLISAITRKSGIVENQLVITERGGLNPGTWMHEDVALEFARWLSPAFAIWCNDRIKELLKHGITATPQTIESILADPANGIKLLQALQVVQNSLNKKIQNLFANSKNIRMFAVLQSDRFIYSAGQAVKLLNKYIGLFLFPTVKYWRLPIRKLLDALGVDYQLVAAYMAAAFLLPKMSNL